MSHESLSSRSDYLPYEGRFALPDMSQQDNALSRIAKSAATGEQFRELTRDNSASILGYTAVRVGQRGISVVAGMCLAFDVEEPVTAMRSDLTREDVLRFGTDGFLMLEHFATPADVQQMAELVDGVFTRYSRRNARRLRNLAGDRGAEGMPTIAEINRVSLIERRLRPTRVFQRCRDIAQQLTGRRMFYAYDHAIFKQRDGKGTLAWHQDRAYRGDDIDCQTLHFWIPLQDVDKQNGCMHFIRGSHRQDLIPHQRVAAAREQKVLYIPSVDESKAVAVPLRVGQACVFTAYTVHRSGPNHTEQTRRAWIVHFGPYGMLKSLYPKHVVATIRRFFD